VLDRSFCPADAQHIQHVKLSMSLVSLIGPSNAQALGCDWFALVSKPAL